MSGPSSPQAGILLLMASIGFITVVDTIAKYLTVELHALQLVWGYFLGIAVLLTAYLTLTGGDRQRRLMTRRLPTQLLRAGLLVTSIAALFVGLTHLPIADATAISFMSPLFITVLSVPLLGERVGPHRWAAVVIGLIGVLIIVRPGGGIAHWSAAMPLISAVAFAGYQIATRLLAATEFTFTTLFYTGVGGFVWISLAVPFVWTWPTPAQWGVFFALGALGIAAHLCLIRAFALAQASLLAPFNYTKLIWAAVLGYLVFGDVPSLNTLAGCVVIVGAGCYVIWRERQLQYAA